MKSNASIGLVGCIRRSIANANGELNIPKKICLGEVTVERKYENKAPTHYKLELYIENENIISNRENILTKLRNKYGEENLDIGYNKISIYHNFSNDVLYDEEEIKQIGKQRGERRLGKIILEEARENIIKFLEPHIKELRAILED